VEIVFVTSEITPYSRSGEIGDVCAALPKALRSIGHKVTVISPLWAGIDPNARGLARRLSGVEVELGTTRYACTLHDGRTTGGVELLFVGQAELFAEPPDGSGEGRIDAALVLAKAAAQVLGARSPLPEVVHAHGWFAAAVLPLLQQALPSTVRVMSLHDARQQGRLRGRPAGVELPDAVRELAGADDEASVLRAGIAAAQRVVASSETEAFALLDGSHAAHGLQQALAPEGKLLGILNGLDAARWNPMTDPLLPSRFDPADLRGKARCKDALQLELELPVRPDVPLVACVGSLSSSSGTALLAEVAVPLLRNDVQLVIVASEPARLDALRALVDRHSDRLRVLDAADERAQHVAVAAADFLLLPRRDPRHPDLHLCAQRYGALPVARKLDAMADAVVDCDADLGTGTGFAVEGDDAAALLSAAQRALGAFGKRKAFEALRHRVMKLDLSWERSARRYEHLYRSNKPSAS
jgi:starch synthase